MTTSISTLPNGLTVVSHYMPDMKSVSLGIWVKAGARNETEEQNGIAHFLEHMSFKGTNKRPSEEIAATIENVGGYINAYTSKELTAYYCNVMKHDVRIGMDLISDIVTNSIYPQHELDAERGVVLQEIERSYDNPSSMVFSLLSEASYPNQPMGRTILGPSDNIRSFGRDVFQDFVETHYRPNNMIVAASGAIRHDDFVKLADEYLGYMLPSLTPRAEEAVRAGGEKILEKKALAQAQFALAFDAPAIDSPYSIEAKLYSMILGSGMSSRLFQNVREKHGLCYSIMSSYDAGPDYGNITIYSGTTDEHIAKMGELVIDELRRLPLDVKEEELNRAKIRLKAANSMQQDSPSSRTDQLARMMAKYGYVKSDFDFKNEINEVTLTDIKAYGEGLTLYLDADMSMALYGQISQAHSLETLKKRLTSG